MPNDIATVNVQLANGSLAVVNADDFDPARHRAIAGDADSEHAASAAADRFAKDQGEVEAEEANAPDGRRRGLPGKGDGVRGANQEIVAGGRRVILHSERAPSDVPTSGPHPSRIGGGAIKVKRHSDGAEVLILRGEFNPSIHTLLIDDPVTKASSFEPSPVDPFKPRAEGEGEAPGVKTSNGKAKPAEAAKTGAAAHDKK